MEEWALTVGASQAAEKLIESWVGAALGNLIEFAHLEPIRITPSGGR
jgi:hypothetical protein